MDQKPQHKTRYDEHDRENVGNSLECIGTGNVSPKPTTLLFIYNIVPPVKYLL